MPQNLDSDTSAPYLCQKGAFSFCFFRRVNSGKSPLEAEHRSLHFAIFLLPHSVGGHVLILLKHQEGLQFQGRHSHVLTCTCGQSCYQDIKQRSSDYSSCRLYVWQHLRHLGGKCGFVIFGFALLEFILTPFKARRTFIISLHVNYGLRNRKWMCLGLF